MLALKNVVHIKLITGEELFATFIESSNGYHFISDPLIVEEKTNPNNGSTFITLGKYLPFTESNICQLLDHHVISLHKVQPVLAEYYDCYLEYNNKVIVPYMMENVKNVNYQIAQTLQDITLKELNIDSNATITKNNKLHYPSSNTIH